MIKSFEIQGLLTRNKKFDLQFHEDINIITGQNGSGKTTLLKMLWYLISGNLVRVFAEINFDSLILETDQVRLTIEMAQRNNKDIITATYPRQIIFETFHNKEIDLQKQKIDFDAGIPQSWIELKAISTSIANIENSIFFPTFRRIEGGFSIPNESIVRNTTDLDRKITAILLNLQGFVGLPEYDAGLNLIRAMKNLSKTLGSPRHQFVASISTIDLDQLLSSQYKIFLQQVLKMYQNFSSDTLKDALATQSDDQILKLIKQHLLEIEDKSNKILAPYTQLEALVQEVLQYQGIDFEHYTIGKKEQAIKADVLSAGEKQMLSFLCYNAFTSNSVIFIDEPEISLHVDWQRCLFQYLLAQQTTNQLIVATHSPCIYSQYSDKELILDHKPGEIDGQI